MITCGADASVSETIDCRPDKQWLIDAQDKEIEGLERGFEELANILSPCPGETVLKAAERWRETVRACADKLEEYADEDLLAQCEGSGAMDNPKEFVADAVKRARKLLGEVKKCI